MAEDVESCIGPLTNKPWTKSICPSSNPSNSVITTANPLPRRPNWADLTDDPDSSEELIFGSAFLKPEPFSSLSMRRHHENTEANHDHALLSRGSRPWVCDDIEPLRRSLEPQELLREMVPSQSAIDAASQMQILADAVGYVVGCSRRMAARVSLRMYMDEQVGRRVKCLCIPAKKGACSAMAKDWGKKETCTCEYCHKDLCVLFYLAVNKNRTGKSARQRHNTERAMRWREAGLGTRGIDAENEFLLPPSMLEAAMHYQSNMVALNLALQLACVACIWRITQSIVYILFLTSSIIAVVVRHVWFPIHDQVRCVFIDCHRNSFQEIMEEIDVFKVLARRPEVGIDVITLQSVVAQYHSRFVRMIVWFWHTCQRINCAFDRSICHPPQIQTRIVHIAGDHWIIDQHSEELKQFVKNNDDGLWLLVLSSCCSDSVNHARSLMSDQKIANVIHFETDVHGLVAVQFSAWLYLALYEGQSISRAFHNAKAEIQQIAPEVVVRMDSRRHENDRSRPTQCERKRAGGVWLLSCVFLLGIFPVFLQRHTPQQKNYASLPRTEVLRFCEGPFLHRERIQSESDLDRIISLLRQESQSGNRDVCLAEAFKWKGQWKPYWDLVNLTCSSSSQKPSGFIHVACALLYYDQRRATNSLEARRHAHQAVDRTCFSEFHAYACARSRLLLAERLRITASEPRDLLFAASNASSVAQSLSASMEQRLEAFAEWAFAVHYHDGPQAATDVFMKAHRVGLLSAQQLGRHYSLSLATVVSVFLRRAAEAFAQSSEKRDDENIVQEWLALARHYSTLFDSAMHGKVHLTEAKVLLKLQRHSDLGKAERLIREGCRLTQAAHGKPSDPVNYRCYREQLYFAEVRGKELGEVECDALRQAELLIAEQRWPLYDPDVQDIITINASLRRRAPSWWCQADHSQWPIPPMYKTSEL